MTATALFYTYRHDLDGILKPGLVTQVVSTSSLGTEAEGSQVQGLLMLECVQSQPGQFSKDLCLKFLKGASVGSVDWQ